MWKTLIALFALSLVLSACGKSESETEAKQQAQIQMQADLARLDLQEKANAMARNPPPKKSEAVNAQAAAENKKAAEEK